MTGLAVLGTVVGLLTQLWRRETTLFLLWIGVTYLALTYLKAKDPRYLLPLATPLTCLAAIAIVSLVRWVGKQTGAGSLTLLAPNDDWQATIVGQAACLSATPTGQARLPVLRSSHPMLYPLVLAAVLPLLALQAWDAWRRPVPVVRGFPELIAFLNKVAPDEPIFYDGYCDGVFSFYARANDEALRGRVVRGDQLLYEAPLNGSMPTREFVSTRGDVIEALQHSGCRWLAIEVGSNTSTCTGGTTSSGSRPRARVRVRGSFAVTGRGVERVDVYRLLRPVEPVEYIELRLSQLGPDVRLKVRPIAPRR